VSARPGLSVRPSTRRHLTPPGEMTTHTEDPRHKPPNIRPPGQKNRTKVPHAHVHGQVMGCSSPQIPNCPLNWAWPRAGDPFSKFWDPVHILQMDRATLFKLGTHLKDGQFQLVTVLPTATRELSDIDRTAITGYTEMSHSYQNGQILTHYT